MPAFHSSFLPVRAALLLLAVPTSGGCGLISFDTTVDIAPQVIPGVAAAAAVQPTTITASAITLDSKNLPSNADLADSVKLSSVTLIITAPSDGTFDFLTDVTLTITAPGLPDRQLAAGTPQAGSAQLVLTPTGDIDLLPYIHAGAIVLATGTGRPPTADTTIAGQAVLNVSI